MSMSFVVSFGSEKVLVEQMISASCAEINRNFIKRIDSDPCRHTFDQKVRPQKNVIPSRCHCSLYMQDNPYLHISVLGIRDP